MVAMINTESESLIRLRDVPAWTKEKLGNRVHPSTVHRWRLRGTRGVRLETILAGGTRYTSIEALNRFFAATTTAADGGATPTIAKVPDSKSIRDAEAFLCSEGI